MKSVRILSLVLYYIAQFAGWTYLALSTFGALSSFFNLTAFSIVDDGARFELLIPFTTVPFLLGENTLPFLIEMFLAMALYGLFFLMASNVFFTFCQEKLFTQSGIKYLTQFYWVNFVVPFLFVLIMFFVGRTEAVLFFFVIVHAVLGIFSYFLAAIFQQGVLLQNEQDLYI